MKYVIPQEFDQSDKIGKITMPQAAVLGIGATVWVLIVISSSLLMSLLTFFPIAFFTLVFMFVRINKVPLYEFVMIYVLYVGTPKLLIFRSDNLKSLEDKEDEIGFIEFQKKEVKITNKNEKAAPKKEVKRTAKSIPTKKSNTAKKAPAKQVVKKKGVKK